MTDSERSGLAFSLFDNLLEGCQVLGFDWRYMYLNKAAEIHNRRSNNGLQGKTYTEIWPGIEATGVYAIIKACMEERTSKKIENEFIYPDGLISWFLLSIQPLPMGVLILSIDITDNKLSERKMMESEEKFRIFFESSMDAILINDLDGNIISANPAACEMFQMNENELTKRCRPDIVDTADSRVVTMLAERKEKGKVKGELTFKRADGTKFPADLTSSVYTDSKGNQRASLIIRDITERKHSEKKIRQLNEELEKRVIQRTEQFENANKEMETFIYSVSHDLKTPLRGIDGYSKLLADMYKDKLSEEAIHFISSIRNSTLKMNQIIEDLLEYSRLEKSQATREQIRIKDLINLVLSDYPEQILNNHLKLKILSDDLVLFADMKGLEIALRNLIQNAVKFSSVKPEPEIVISVSENENSWLITIKDNGVGFDMKYSQKIFVIFQRLHRIEDFPGTGIGLAMVSKAIQKMNGRVWAESSPGEGSEFYLEIPK